jgi:hypothetical protein
MPFHQLKEYLSKPLFLANFGLQSSLPISVCGFMFKLMNLKTAMEDRNLQRSFYYYTLPSGKIIKPPYAS